MASGSTLDYSGSSFAFQKIDRGASIGRDDTTFMGELRKAASQPPLVSKFLRDPKMQRYVEASRSRRDAASENTTQSMQGRWPAKKKSFADRVVDEILADDEREINETKQVLRDMSAQLGSEISRATQAEALAREAIESARSKDEELRAAGATIVQLREEARRYQMQLDLANKESRRIQEHLEKAIQERDVLDASRERWKDALGIWQRTLEEERTEEARRREQQHAELDKEYNDGHEIGAAEGRQKGYSHGYQEGYNAGLEAGQQQGIEKGMAIGRQHGFADGVEEARVRERARAMFALEKALEPIHTAESEAGFHWDVGRRDGGWEEATSQGQPASVSD